MKTSILACMLLVSVLSAKVDVGFKIWPRNEPLPWRIHLHGLESSYQKSVSVDAYNKNEGLSGLSSCKIEDVPAGRYLLYYQIGLGNYVKALELKIEDHVFRNYDVNGFSLYPKVRINFETIPLAYRQNEVAIRYSCYRKSDVSDLWYEVSFYPSMQIMRGESESYYAILNAAEEGEYLFIVGHGDARHSFNFKLLQKHINTLSVDSKDLAYWKNFEESRFEIFKLEQLLKGDHTNNDSFDPFKD